MKKLIIAAMLLSLTVAATAQDNTWEQIEQQSDKPSNPDAKYLAGAVPEVDGKVVFSTTIKAPGKSAKQIYDLLLKDFEKITKESNQFEQSRIVLTDSVKMQIVGSYQEWLVFKNKPLSLDRTRLFYNLIADCRDGEATIQMTRIHYLYDEERNPTTYRAEEWITDRYGLNKKQTKLARVSGKFRRKTIDRKDYLFSRFQKLLEN
jgi:colicin import membrane protein